MFNDKKARFAAFLFIAVVIVLPIFGLLIMDDQLTKANDITGSVAIDNASDGNQIFAGILLIALVAVGLVSLLVKFSNRRKESKENVDAKIVRLSQEIKKL